MKNSTAAVSRRAFAAATVAFDTCVVGGVDRNRLTGDGLTAGLDFGLTIATLLRGKDEAERVALIIEYVPQPAISRRERR